MNDIGMQIFEFFVELAGVQYLSELLSSLDSLDQATKDVFSVIGVIICIVGLLQCFFGFKLFKFWCSIVGLFLGIIFGVALAASGAFSASPAANLIGILMIIILAITGAFIAYRAYLVGLFIYAFVAAFLFAFSIIALITDSIIIGLGVGIAAGLALGIVAVMFRRFWIIVTTSVSGGISVCAGLMMVIQSTDLGWVFVLPPILVIAGFFVQNITVKKGKKANQPQPATTVLQVYPAGMQPVQYQEQPPTEQQIAPQVDPGADTQPIPTVAQPQQAGEDRGNNITCDNCGHSPIDNTAPCRGCGSAVHVN